MKCNYPGAYKHNKMTVEERKEFEAKLLEHLASKRLFFPNVPGLKKYSTTIK